MTKWQARIIPSEHDGKTCRVAVYHHGAHEVHVAAWNPGIIRGAVLAKQSDEIVGYAIEYLFASLETRHFPYSYARLDDVRVDQ